MIFLDDRTSRWALNLIRAGRETGPLPIYGDATWWTYQAGQPQRLAAIIVAAEARRHDLHPEVIAEDLRQQLADEDEALWERVRSTSYDVSAAHDWVAESRRRTFAELQQRRSA